MIKRFVLLSLLLTTFINSDLCSQSRVEIKNSFYDAESWILFEDYQEALPLYQQLLKLYPTNSNFKYRIGQCYINTPGEKAKAISYLEDAVKNINPKYKEGKFKETGAPHDALYYLANAYRINNQLDKAIETYKQFKKDLDSEVYDSVIVNMQIQSCINAKEIISNPVFIKEKNLGSLINESNSEFNPVISDDEKMLVFSKSEAFYDAILFSIKNNGKWSGPINLNEMLQVDRDLFPTSLSKDGKTLYLYSSAEYDGIIYTSKFENNVWSPVVKLNDNINTKFWESHATVSHDNKKLYFTSNRKGTLGGLDIYISKRDSTGDWGPAENLGPVINTPYNEESPFLSEDDKTLFFSSRGHFNMGGYDVFYSTLLSDNKWSVPLNVGYPLNTTDDDVFFNPLNQGYQGYYAKESPGGYGKQDIYKIEIFSNDHPRKFFIRGMVKVADLLSNINDSVKISAMNIKNPNQTVIVYSNPKTSEYEFQLPQGSYEITYQGDGSEKIVKNLELLLTNPSDSFVLPGTILPRTDFVADLSLESNKTISVATGDTLLFPIKAEPNSTLRVEHWVGDSLISVEQFKITESPFNYKMVPKPGDNKLVFILTDKFNNTTSTEVFITRQKDVTRQTLIRPEYSRIIAKKQVAAFTALLINRADSKLKKVIEESNVGKQQFGNVDEVVSYLKEEAAKKSISPEELDKLALKVAVFDNVLTQAAVDLMARYSEGDLKNLLEDLDIYQANLKTWTDLQEYIESKTGGKIKPNDLNKIAADILADVDPAIALIKEKILIYSNNSKESTIIRQSVTSVDKSNMKTREGWLQSFYNQTINLGSTSNNMSELLVTISSLPGSDVYKYLGDLAGQSDEPVKSALKAIDLKKEKIKNPEELLTYLITNKDKTKYPEDDVFKAIANLITIKDINADIINKQVSSTGSTNLWILWIIIGSGLIFVFFLFWKRRNKNKE
jgi:LPXTG-motif cell wall-anchored protein